MHGWDTTHNIPRKLQLIDWTNLKAIWVKCFIFTVVKMLFPLLLCCTPHSLGSSSEAKYWRNLDRLYVWVVGRSIVCCHAAWDVQVIPCFSWQGQSFQYLNTDVGWWTISSVFLLHFWLFAMYLADPDKARAALQTCLSLIAWLICWFFFSPGFTAPQRPNILRLFFQ